MGHILMFYHAHFQKKIEPIMHKKKKTLIIMKDIAKHHCSNTIVQ